jgi:hypothetical protein
MPLSSPTRRSQPTSRDSRRIANTWMWYLASGEEVIGWASIDRLIVSVPYDEAKDAPGPCPT